MKKLLVLLMTAFLLISCIGCNSENKSGFDTAKMFKATVIEVNNECLIVEPSQDYSESKSADKIEVSIGHLDLDLSINTGDIIEVYYDGVIQESYPAVATKVVHIKKIEQ